MSVFKQKSEENIKAIDILISSKLNTPVIHCAYYSSLQLILHYFYEYCGVKEEDVRKEVDYKSGSHNYYLNKLVQELVKINSKNALAFHKYFSNFKSKRNEADYSDVAVSEDDIKKAKDKAISIKKFFTHLENGKCEDISNF